MLADKYSNVQKGQLSNTVQKPNTFIDQVIKFISDQLPVWRDRKNRPAATAETVLTSHLCGHLNSSSRMLSGWDILQFRTEERDADNASRTLDLVAAPSGAVIKVDGRNYTDFDYLFPIECKRLPTPSGSNRDEREYVASSVSSTGGIDRFKRGLHGSGYEQGMMIGFVQSHNCSHWYTAINDWIKELVAGNVLNWELTDILTNFDHYQKLGSSLSTSIHIRDNNLNEIKLVHAWIQMN